MKRLNLCCNHKQEENNSIFSTFNCHYCKLLRENKDLQVKIKQLEISDAIYQTKIMSKAYLHIKRLRTAYDKLKNKKLG